MYDMVWAFKTQNRKQDVEDVVYSYIVNCGVVVRNLSGLVGRLAFLLLNHTELNTAKISHLYVKLTHMSTHKYTHVADFTPPFILPLSFTRHPSFSMLVSPHPRRRKDWIPFLAT